MMFVWCSETLLYACSKVIRRLMRLPVLHGLVREPLLKKQPSLSLPSQHHCASTIAYDPVAERIFSPTPAVMLHDEISANANSDDTLNKLHEWLVTAKNQAREMKASRVIVRAVVSEPVKRSLLGTGPEEPSMIQPVDPFKIEAVIPLEHRANKGALLYFAWNDPSRRPSPEITKQQDQLLEHILATKPALQPEEALRRGLCTTRFEILNGRPLSDVDRAQILQIDSQSFQAFQYSLADKLDLYLSKPKEYLLIAARDLKNNQIYSFGYIEISNVELSDPTLRSQGETLRLGELAYCGRLHDTVGDRPRGVAAAWRLALAALAASTQDVDICFAESRAANAGVTTTNRRMGMTYAGRLLQHIYIDGPRDIQAEKNSRFEDFGAWYLSQRSLRAIVQCVNTKCTLESGFVHLSNLKEL